MFAAESCIRAYARNYSNSYHISLFASCRENYNQEKVGLPKFEMVKDKFSAKFKDLLIME